jgi:hypothetical protein
MFSYFLFNVIGQNSTSIVLIENLVVKRDKNWLKNEREKAARMNGNLIGINCSCFQWPKWYFMDVIGNLTKGRSFIMA